jgi:vesicle transport through interaction with t-SNAREs protein 1
MDSAYVQYEQEFSRKINTIKSKIAQVRKLTGENKKNTVQEVERLLEDAKHTLRNMEEYVSKTNNRSLQQKNRSHLNELTGLQRDLQNAQMDTFARNPEYGYSDDIEAQNMDQRMRLLHGNQKLDETSDRLQNTERIAVETEGIGVSVLGELSNQRQQLERTRDNLGKIDDNITRSRKILASMSRRIATNKMILAFIILILAAAIGLIVYFKWLSPLINKAKQN